jgi:hypothetical protein
LKTKGKYKDTYQGRLINIKIGLVILTANKEVLLMLRKGTHC